MGVLEGVNVTVGVPGVYVLVGVFVIVGVLVMVRVGVIVGMLLVVCGLRVHLSGFAVPSMNSKVRAAR
jgi:hypothetical protein